MKTCALNRQLSDSTESTLTCSNMKSVSLQHQICNLVGNHEFKVVSLFQRSRQIILSKIYFTFVTFVPPLLVHVELYSGSVFWHMMHASGSAQGSYDNIPKIPPPLKKKVCRFSGIFGKFTNITNIEFGSNGRPTNTIFDQPYCFKKILLGLYDILDYKKH